LGLLGFNSEDGLYFERQGGISGHALIPSPVVCVAQWQLNSVPSFSTVSRVEDAQLIFREDAFDPITRLRRGRFYKRDTNCDSWTVLPMPGVCAWGSDQVQENGQIWKQRMKGFSEANPFNALGAKSTDQIFVALGAGELSSLWVVVAAEAIHSGDTLVTLKARQSLGALPEMNWDQVPATGHAKLREELDRLANEFRKAGPESVVDRAREAATAILKTWIWHNVSDEKRSKKNLNDLGPLIEFWEELHDIHRGRGVACAAASIAYAAEIPQRFHSRGKHMEKERLNLRPVREQDAELAVLCIGTMLCDLGWAEWR